MLKACGIISLRVKRLVDMVCKFSICLWADLMRIGAEGSGPYAVVRDGLCLYAISRSSFPFLSGEKKSADARLPATHEARTKRDVATTLLFESPSPTQLLTQSRQGLKINLHTSSGLF